mmetsp:Transcript_31526/g.42689  ORF Transcript_31526/g.42689 Transcript_31526/m.42689 type:complete len:232 (-) Transcript_31526:204-899(-)
MEQVILHPIISAALRIKRVYRDVLLQPRLGLHVEEPRVVVVVVAGEPPEDEEHVSRDDERVVDSRGRHRVTEGRHLRPVGVGAVVIPEVVEEKGVCPVRHEPSPPLGDVTRCHAIPVAWTLRVHVGEVSGVAPMEPHDIIREVEKHDVTRTGAGPVDGAGLLPSGGVSVPRGGETPGFGGQLRPRPKPVALIWDLLSLVQQAFLVDPEVVEVPPLRVGVHLAPVVRIRVVF